MPEFLIRVTRDINSNITSLYSPDFGLELLEYNNNSDIDAHYQEFLRHLFITHLIELAPEMTPKTYAELTKYIRINSAQCWESLTFAYQPNKFKPGVFAKGLPIIGHLTNILGVLSGGFITYMTLMVPSSNDSQEDSSSLSNTLSILGTFLSSFISVIMYIYSDATGMLAGIGHNIDQALLRTCTKDYELLENKDPSTSGIKKGMQLIAGSIVLANIAILGVTAYKQGNIISEKYLDLYHDLTDSERETYNHLIKWLVVNLYVAVGAYTFLAFQGSFAIKLVDELASKFEKKNSDSKLHESLLSADKNSGVFYLYPKATNSATELGYGVFDSEQTVESGHVLNRNCSVCKF